MDLTHLSVAELDELQNKPVKFDLLEKEHSNKPKLDTLEGKFLNFGYEKVIGKGEVLVSKAEFEYLDGTSKIFHVYEVGNIVRLDE